MTDNTKRLLIVVLAFVLLMVGAGVLYGKLSAGNTAGQLAPTEPAVTEDDAPAQEPEAEPELQQAPDVTFYDLDGTAHKLSDYFGKPIVINFWASWCGPCKMEMPDFQEKYQTLGDDVQFLMVNMTTSQRENLDSASDYVAEQGFTFPVFYDTTGEVMTTFGVYSYPTTYFLDAEGNFIAYATGAIDSDTLQTGIDMITE